MQVVGVKKKELAGFHFYSNGARVRPPTLSGLVGNLRQYRQGFSFVYSNGGGVRPVVPLILGFGKSGSQLPKTTRCSADDV